MVNYVGRRNNVRESVYSKRAKAIFVSESNRKDDIVRDAIANGIPVRVCSNNELNNLMGDTFHQGFVASVEEYKTIELKELIRKSKSKPNPVILMLDGIEDPHNMGAIMRSVDAFGVDGIVIKSRGNAPLNATVARVSTGAIHHVDVVSVNNLSQAISELKDAGFWIVASDGSATKSYAEIDYNCPICLIVGSEGFGISKLVLQRSDFIVKIPMKGHVNSLNASVATGILLSYISLKH